MPAAIRFVECLKAKTLAIGNADSASDGYDTEIERMAVMRGLWPGILAVVIVAGCGKNDSGTGHSVPPVAAVPSKKESAKEGAGGVRPEPVRTAAAASQAGETKKAAIVAPGPSKARAVFDKLVAAHHNEDPEAWIAADAELSRMGKDAAGVLADGLSSSDRPTRELAAMMLVKIGPDASVAEAGLLKSLNDASSLVRANAASALSLMGGHSEEIVPVLKGLLDEGGPNVRTMAMYTLGNVGKSAVSAVPKMIELLSDDDLELRTAAVISLGNMGAVAQKAIPPLKKLEANDVESIRTAAKESLIKIQTPAPEATVATTPAVVRVPATEPPPSVVANSDTEADGEEPALAEIPTAQEPISRLISIEVEQKPVPASGGPKLTGPQLAPPN